LQALRESRLRLEYELTTIAAGSRTLRITGSIRKALELAKKKGRADIDDFLQQNFRKPGVERKLRRTNYSNEENAIHMLEDVAKIFNKNSNHDYSDQDQFDKIPCSLRIHYICNCHNSQRNMIRL
jgi:hypothetical protein